MRSEQERIVGCFGLMLALFICGCQVPFGGSPLGAQGCRRCHVVTVDPDHDMGCTVCHQGDADGYLRSEAHRDLVAAPGHPLHMARACGPCHPAEVTAARSSRHYTLEGEIGGVWSVYFPGEEAPGLDAIPVEEPPVSAQGLVADLLRRRCLRCHVFYRGDSYSGTRRGTGCAACHLEGPAGAPGDHVFRGEVRDQRCLACHHGNFVGWDYYGRFEKDYDADYRAPLRRGAQLARPYGVEWLQMTPDCHASAGMACTVCHREGPCRERGDDGVLGRACMDCHGGGPDAAFSGAPLVPEVPGHGDEDRALVDCAVCHAVWSFQDNGRELVRQDNPDYEGWMYLAVQGSSEVEEAVLYSLDRPWEAWEDASMMDKLDGARRPGMWFESFRDRRWGPPVLGEDDAGRLRVLRPLLDISLGYVDMWERVVFDGLRPAAAGWVPFHPHTIGPPDTFRTLQVNAWLAARKPASAAESGGTTAGGPDHLPPAASAPF